MSRDGEVAEKIKETRQRLLQLMSEARAVEQALHHVGEALKQVDEELKRAVHRQTDLKASITMTLDSLDLIEAKLRGRPASP